jgi:precorrin-6B methylase 2
MRVHSQEPLHDFLRAGGRFTRRSVDYGGVSVDRAPFTGPNLAGVAYLHRFVDFGGRITKSDDLYLITLPNGLTFETEGWRLVDTILMMVERFIDDEYAWIEVDKRVVIDVGANIGDSVIYFAHKGATFVYGFEPERAAFETSERNLARNHIENALVEHVAVTRDGKGGVAFNEVLRHAAAKHPAAEIVCKIDCEGCEYELLAPGSLEPGAMQRVTQVMVEYHSAVAPSEGLRRLGYEVDIEPGAGGVGWMRARRAR